ncbi:MAG: phosphate acyltransferase PlsX, partial [Christensenellaceae bacterium]
MNKRYKIAIDAMGGDNAPGVVVEGALAALQEKDDFEVIFVGDKDRIGECLKDKTYDRDRVKIVHTTQIIEMAESPVAALRRKKDSSMAVAFRLVRENEADGAVSAGNTGAIIAGATMILGRLEGVARPVLSATLPTLKEHNVILLDAGANVDCRPGYLQQFAIMASVYLENVEGIENPRIGLLSNGSEDEKGDSLTKEAYALIKECDINFTGNIEAREAQSGDVHAIICDGFAGN